MYIVWILYFSSLTSCFLLFFDICQSYEIANNNSTRILLAKSFHLHESSSRVKDFKGKGYREKAKANRLKKLVTRALSEDNIPKTFTKESFSSDHRPDSKYVILSAAIRAGTDITPEDVHNFAGTARKYGFDGDIVVAVRADDADDIWRSLRSKYYSLIVYNTMRTANCTGVEYDVMCSFYGLPVQLQINFMRYYLYRWWASMYGSNTLIMVSDFRDVFFQSNPFVYKIHEWAPPVSELVVFQEAHPNAVIGRCVFNKGWIENCYGTKGLSKIAHRTVSCSGVSFGTRDAIIAYSYLLTRQWDLRVRWGEQAATRNNKECLSAGMDQGFHNWILYTGVLDRYMNVQIYQQGEGPVNTVGGFFGERKLLKFSLREWGILKGAEPNAFIVNWNGDRSPVVHQFDRFEVNLTEKMDAVAEPAREGYALPKIFF